MEAKREDGKVIDNRLDLECWIDWRGKEIRVDRPNRDGKIDFRNIRIHLYDNREFSVPFDCPDGGVANEEELRGFLKERFRSLPSPYAGLTNFGSSEVCEKVYWGLSQSSAPGRIAI